MLNIQIMLLVIEAFGLGDWILNGFVPFMVGLVGFQQLLST